MADAIGDVQRLIDDYTAQDRTIRLLEAGCGSMSKLRLSPNVQVTGVDISEKQLARNTELCERILGDIQTCSLPTRSFDVIICWDVLEHLHNPQLALTNFFRAIKPDGLIILAFPNLYSLKGMITKLTPHFVHVWYYRHLLHTPEAGLHDTPPFVTPFRLAATYPSIRQLAAANHARVQYFALRESNDMRYVRRNFRFIAFIMRTASIISRLLTLGRIDAMDSDCIMVLRSGANA